MINKDEVFLGRYSSSNFSDFYTEYKEFMLKFNEAPLAVRKQFMHEDRSYDYNKLAQLFNGYKSKNTQVLFRKSAKAKNFIVDLWLSKVRNKVRVLESLSIPKFCGLNQTQAMEILSSSVNDKSYISIPSLLIPYGIVVIFEESLPGLNLDGAAYTNEQGNPIISLSIRHNRIDNFWFTLAHELAHIILHYDYLRDLILEDLDDLDDNSQGQEFEANKLAGDMLIPRRIWRSCPVKFSTSSPEVIQFAREVNIHPAIIAGRIRKERSNHSLFTDIIHSTDLRKDLF